jgi:NAD(P)-dependent dehydrogenase (short-subunit alcohol dehydrogenase family)
LEITLNNKVAIVTGAAGNIGEACARILASSGAKVALVDYNWKNLVEITRNLCKSGMTAKGYELDVTNVPAISKVVTKIRQDLGEVDILVCVAGTNIRAQAQDVKEADWDMVNATNTKALFFCNQTVAVQSMIPRRLGSIVNIASVYGLVGGPNVAAYCASKGGVVQITRAEAIDWAPFNIRVNAVAPTYVITNLTKDYLDIPEVRDYILDNIPLRRFATVDDVATTVCFLASDTASMITGTIIPVDGGWTAR